MAQAEDTNARTQARTEAGFAWRCFEMESDVCDIAQMAKIAEITLHGVLGDTEFHGTAVVRDNLTSEGIARAQFAVSHVAKLITDFQAKYFDAPLSAAAAH